MSLNSISQKEYLKKYLSGDVKKKKKKKIGGSNIKRSVVVDDDIDLKSMRPLEDDEVELYQMDEDAPLIAGIVDERPPEVKAQEQYSSKRWKVFGGEDGVNVVDSMKKDHLDSGEASKTLTNFDNTDYPSEEENSYKKNKPDKDINKIKLDKEILKNKKPSSRDTDLYSSPKVTSAKQASLSSRQHLKPNYNQSGSDKSQKRIERHKSSHYVDDYDVSPPRKHDKNSSSDLHASPPRKKSQMKYQQGGSDSDESLPRKDSKKRSPKPSNRYQEKNRGNRRRSYSNSPPRRDKTKRQNYKSDSDTSPPRRKKHSYKKDKSDSDASPPRKKDKLKTYVNGSPLIREKNSYNRENSDSDASPPRRTEKYPSDYKSRGRARRGSFSDSDNSPPRRERRKSPKPEVSRRRFSRSRTPTEKNSFSKTKTLHRGRSPRLTRIDKNERTFKTHASDSDNSSQRRRTKRNGSDSDMSPPRKKSTHLVNDRPLKKVLYKPNDDSSSDEGPKSKSNKMKTTLDGKQAGLQDAKQLKKELSDLKMKEDTMFSRMDASVSGVGAAPVKRDRKTGQIRDLEKEKEVDREKKAKESVVTETYHKWGKGIKQMEDAAVRAAEAMKEMNKPLARYVDDKDLDEFLKAQERDGDPMLDYIKQKQSESTPLQGEKPIYKGSWNPNRFNIRPGYRWDGVVRSSGYEQEWFKTKNAKKARDDEAYKWSTSDM